MAFHQLQVQCHMIFKGNPDVDPIPIFLPWLRQKPCSQRRLLFLTYSQALGGATQGPQDLRKSCAEPSTAKRPTAKPKGPIHSLNIVDLFAAKMHCIVKVASW